MTGVEECKIVVAQSTSKKKVVESGATAQSADKKMPEATPAKEEPVVSPQKSKAKEFEEPVQAKPISLFNNNSNGFGSNFQKPNSSFLFGNSKPEVVEASPGLITAEKPKQSLFGGPIIGVLPTPSPQAAPTTSLFGSSAPIALSGTGLFGGPKTGGGLFGANPPPPGGSLFGSAPIGNLFSKPDPNVAVTDNKDNESDGAYAPEEDEPPTVQLGEDVNTKSPF